MSKPKEPKSIQESMEMLATTMMLEHRLYLMNELLQMGSIPPSFYKSTLEKLALNEMPELGTWLNDEDD